jgi:soluble lytic murein transglycosylase
VKRPLLLALSLVAVMGVLLVAAQVTLPAWYVRLMPSWYARQVYPLRETAAINEGARKYALDPALVAAVVYQESRFRDQTTSSRGAVGLMQLLPSTAQEIARRSGGRTFVIADLKNGRINILYGCNYLRYLLDRFRGSTVEATAAYNAGVANVDAWLRGRGLAPLQVSDIPFAETRDYVRHVGLLTDVYRRAYATELGPRPAGFRPIP